MPPKFLIVFLLLIGFSTELFSQVTLVGNWKRVIPV